ELSARMADESFNREELVMATRAKVKGLYPRVGALVPARVPAPPEIRVGSETDSNTSPHPPVFKECQTTQIRPQCHPPNQTMRWCCRPRLCWSWPGGRKPLNA